MAVAAFALAGCSEPTKAQWEIESGTESVQPLEAVVLHSRDARLAGDLSAKLGTTSVTLIKIDDDRAAFVVPRDASGEVALSVAGFQDVTFAVTPVTIPDPTAVIDHVFDTQIAALDAWAMSNSTSAYADAVRDASTRLGVLRMQANALDADGRSALALALLSNHADEIDLPIVAAFGDATDEQFVQDAQRLKLNWRHVAGSIALIAFGTVTAESGVGAAVGVAGAIALSKDIPALKQAVKDTLDHTIFPALDAFFDESSALFAPMQLVLRDKVEQPLPLNGNFRSVQPEDGDSADPLVSDVAHILAALPDWEMHVNAAVDPDYDPISTSAMQESHAIRAEDLELKSKSSQLTLSTRSVDGNYLVRPDAQECDADYPVSLRYVPDSYEVVTTLRVSCSCYGDATYHFVRTTPPTGTINDDGSGPMDCAQLPSSRQVTYVALCGYDDSAMDISLSNDTFGIAMADATCTIDYPKPGSFCRFLFARTSNSVTLDLTLTDPNGSGACTFHYDAPL